MIDPREWEGRIYVGDCLDFMRGLPDGCVDAVVTDPPYPAIVGGPHRRWIGGKRFGAAGESKNPTSAVGQPWDSSTEWCAAAWRVARLGVMCFGTHKDLVPFALAFGNPPPKALIVWHKSNVGPTPAGHPHLDAEFVWCWSKAPGLHWDSLKTVVFDIPKLQAGCFASERLLERDSLRAAHPTQKPERLMAKLLAVTRPDDLVFDPFLGSGTTAVVCERLGRRWIGCEINPEYAAMAEKRIQRERDKLQLPFDAAEGSLIPQKLEV